MTTFRTGIDGRHAPWRIVLGVLALYGYVLAGFGAASLDARAASAGGGHAFALCTPSGAASDDSDGSPAAEHATCCLTACLGVAHPAPTAAAIVPPAPGMRDSTSIPAIPLVVPAAPAAFLARAPPVPVRPSST